MQVSSIVRQQKKIGENMYACEKCWNDAYLISRHIGKVKVTVILNYYRREKKILALQRRWQDNSGTKKNSKIKDHCYLTTRST